MLNKKWIKYLVVLCLSCTVINSNSADSGYTETRYPIVLAHGFMGFNSILGILDYWPGLSEALTKDGAKVLIAQTSTLNSSPFRGELLIKQIEEFLAINGADKINLWGHSQGALDARYVTSVRPDLIASITSIAGPHSVDIDAVFADNTSLDNLAPLIKFTASFIQLLSNNQNPMDLDKAFTTLSASGISEINSLYPIGLPTSACGEGPNTEMLAGNEIYIYSWGGVSTWTTFIDPTDALMAWVGSFYPDDVKSDGMVSQCANHLGDVIRDDYKHNHIDLVNLMFGLVPFFEEKPASMFRTHANRLKNIGL